MQRITQEQWEGLFRRLKEGGCPVRRDHGYRMLPLGLAIETIPGMNCSEMFDLQTEGTGYALEVVLRNQLDRPLDIQGFQIKTPWGMPKISLLPAPEKSSPFFPQYVLPDESHYYDVGFVLNPVFARRKTRLKPGEEIEGVLVATGEERIPDEIQHHTRIVLTLSVFDSRRNRYAGRFNVLVDRSALRVRERLAKEWADNKRRKAERSKRHREQQKIADAPAVSKPIEDPYGEEFQRVYLAAMEQYGQLLEIERAKHKGLAGSEELSKKEDSN